MVREEEANGAGDRGGDGVGVVEALGRWIDGETAGAGVGRACGPPAAHDARSVAVTMVATAARHRIR